MSPMKKAKSPVYAIIHMAARLVLLSASMVLLACGSEGSSACAVECPFGCDEQSGECKTQCVFDCAEKECGTDGCGGQCGQCPSEEEGSAQSQCNEETGLCCTPDCEGKQCGPDGCGGECPETCEGVCDPLTGLCGENGPCTPQCDDKACGPDGCGGTCPDTCDGECDPATGICDNSGTCVPNCIDKLCGDDGCGGECPDLCDVDAICDEEKGLCEWQTDPGACQGESDQLISSSGAIEAASEACVWPSYDDWDLAATCFQDATGFSDECTECFQSLFQCAFESCTEECPGTTTPACEQCISTECDEAFMECSGVTYEDEDETP